MVGQLNCAVFGLLRQMDAVELLDRNGEKRSKFIVKLLTLVFRYSFFFLFLPDST